MSIASDSIAVSTSVSGGVSLRGRSTRDESPGSSHDSFSEASTVAFTTRRPENNRAPGTTRAPRKSSPMFPRIRALPVSLLHQSVLGPSTQNTCTKPSFPSPPQPHLQPARAFEIRRARELEEQRKARARANGAPSDELDFVQVEPSPPTSEDDDSDPEF
nr:hypothetical protein CFP56_60197 [Quercus suber]